MQKNIKEDEIDQKEEDTSYNERDLHKLLSSFVQVDAHFKCKTKTIFHEKSIRAVKGKNQWLHPDIVGVYYPFMDYSNQVLKLFSVVCENPYKLFSFELKKELTYTNLREFYFQAVSNSSWAHEGYLVALKINEEDDFIEELRRLNNAFGIGVIRLDPMNISQSKILFTANYHKELDWDTIERLADENEHFRVFIEDVTMDSADNDKRLRGGYDDHFETDEDAQKYAKDKKTI